MFLPVFRLVKGSHRGDQVTWTV